MQADVYRLSQVLKFHRWLFALLAATVVLYSQSIGNGFVNLDDPQLVTKNPIITSPSWHSIMKGLTSFDPELYIPVTFLSYQAEAWMLGLGSWHFHFFSLLLHLGCICLTYSLVRRFTDCRRTAILAAALLAIHPLSSEAVLWISARKDILSAFFLLLSWRLFIAETDKERRIGWSLLAFLLALGAKISAVSLPLLLLATLWYLHGPLTRSRCKRLIPFFALATVFGGIAMFGKSQVIGEQNPLLFLEMMFRSTAFYLRLIAFPIGQAAVHPLANESPAMTSSMTMLSVLLIAVISFLVWRKRRDMTVLAFGWLWYLLALTPTFLHYTRGSAVLILGSERYAYVPSIGIFFVIAVTTVKLHDHPRVGTLLRKAIVGSVACVLLFYCALTWRRTHVFANGVAFNDDIIIQSFTYAPAHYNLGLALEEAGKPQSADDAYTEAMTLDPLYADASINRGILYVREGRTDDALAMFHTATVMRPAYFKGHYNLGVAYLTLGRFADAVAPLERTVELFPDYPLSRRDLATAYGKVGRFADAVNQYRILADLDPGFREQFEKIKSGLK